MLKKLGVYLSLIYIGLVVVPVFIKPSEVETVVAMAEKNNNEKYDFQELENYVIGVVAAEMPANFNEEALKAQAVCARTYAVRHMEETDSRDVPYEIYQAYCTVNDMKEKWGENFDEYYSKISSAVNDTKGQIMIYENEPVLAVFHSMSAGKTEDSANIWGGEIDYLKSVDSSFDSASPGFTDRKVFSTSYIKDILNKNRKSIAFGEDIILVTERTEAGYVKTVKAGNEYFTGRQIRELFGLKSAYFEIEKAGDTIIFETHGYGHGAGMSQYGANHMAEAGISYRQILEHYYTGVELAKIKLKS